MSQNANKEILKKAWRRVLIPPKKLTISEWADANRVLSKEGSAEPGPWDTSRAEYQRGILDAVTDIEIEQIVVMKSSQVGWTELLNNIVGYHIDQDPCPILVLQPTVEMAEAWSQDRLMPMIRDTRCLANIFRNANRSTSNTILHKSFPGGHLTGVGANSPAGLASRPIRLVCGDELDRCPASAGAEGDPVSLAWKRTTAFYNRKGVWGGTPTVDGRSRIQEAFLESDQRYYFVPCPDCGEFQTLKWSNIKWPEGEREKAYYVCEHCGICIQEKQKHWMVLNGEWRATAPFKGIAGFFIWEAYSPFSTWARIALEHKRSKGNPERMKTWTNTVLGETWKEDLDEVDATSLSGRREMYQAQVPKGVLVLTAGLDVQKDRVECEIVGWGAGFESWSIERRVIWGSPESPETWAKVNYLWTEKFHHETGATMIIDAACIDSGYATQHVYEYCRDKRARRIFCIKGKSGSGFPAVSSASPKRTGVNRRPVQLYTVGVDAIKTLTFQRMKVLEPGQPGYMHFPDFYQDDYFDQLTAEAIMVKYERGFPKDVWIKKAGKANEAFDMRVYSTAAVMLLNPPMEQLASQFKDSGVVRVPTAPPTRQYRSRGIAI